MDKEAKEMIYKVVRQHTVGHQYAEGCMTEISDGLDALGYRKLPKDKPPDNDIKDCLDCAREAIVDAICCEDGLDGGAGEKIIKWITDILGDYDEWIKTHSDD